MNDSISVLSRTQQISVGKSSGVVSLLASGQQSIDVVIGTPDTLVNVTRTTPEVHLDVISEAGTVAVINAGPPGPAGANGAGGSGGVVSVADLRTIDSLDRYIGMIAYQTGDTDYLLKGTYQLVGGTTDPYWTPFGVPYVPPTVNLLLDVSLSQAVGTTLSSILATAVIDIGSHFIRKVEFFRGASTQVGSTINHTDNEFTYTDQVTDTSGVTTTTTWRVEVTDQMGVVTSDTVTVTFTASLPTSTLTVGSNTSPYEVGSEPTILFHAIAVPGSYNLSTVKLQRRKDGGAWTDINTYSSVALGVNDNTVTNTPSGLGTYEYRLQVYDGHNTVNSSIVTFTVHYPWFYGCDVAGLNAAGIQALTKDLSRTSKPNATFDFTTNDNRFYIAWPQSWGSLTKFTDTSNNTSYLSNFNSVRTVTIDGATFNVYEYSIDVSGINTYSMAVN